MCTGETTWADLEDLMKRWLDGERCGGKDSVSFSAYGLSKAALMVFTMQMAAKYPNIMVRKQKMSDLTIMVKKYAFIFQSSCVSPGYIQTNLTKGWSGGLTPEQGTISTMRCLFDDLPGNGLFFGSDGLRSPIHVSRNPGEPEYDGKPPVFE